MQTRSISRPFITLQWHLTHRCNWRCRHCYHDTYEGDELKLPELQRIADEFIVLAKKRQLVPELVVTGGEPFVRADFMDFLAYLNRYHADLPRLTILTNGSLLTEKLLTELRQRVQIPIGVQISIEGTERVNDAIRGTGTFATILTAAALVKAMHFPVHLTATVSKLNQSDVFDILDLLLTYDLPLVLRRFIPTGGGTREQAALLTPGELRALYEKAHVLNTQHRLSDGSEIFRTNTCTGGMQELLWPKIPQRRSCGVRHQRILTLMPDGTIYPCRLLPIPLGNIKETTLADVLDGPYAAYTDASKQESTCRTCSAYGRCGGGAPCVSYAIKQNFYARDPQCWKK